MKPMLKYSLNGSANIIRDLPKQSLEGAVCLQNLKVQSYFYKKLQEKNKTPGNLLFNFTVQTAMVRLLVRPIATSP